MPSIEKATPYKTYEDTRADINLLSNLAVKIAKRSENLPVFKIKKLLRGAVGVEGQCAQIQAVAKELDKLFMQTFSGTVVAGPNAKPGTKPAKIEPRLRTR